MPVLPHTVVAYITHGDRLLIVGLPDAPAAELGVPAGATRPGEAPEAAVLRVATAATGLTDLAQVGFLGERVAEVIADTGDTQVRHRRFYHLRCAGEPPELWEHIERGPSDGGPPSHIRCWWVRLPDEAPTLSPDHDAYLAALAERLGLAGGGAAEPPSRPFDPAFARYYNRGREAARLERDQVERARTEELLARFLPPPPAVILDVGGGAGVYALPLAREGYAVHLIDPVPLHVEQARQGSAAQPGHPLASVRVGDARALDRPDAGVDAVLLFGPLYHLTERDDRLGALREACRVLRPGGVALAVGISRFASLVDGLHRALLDDPAFRPIVARDLRDGQHRNPTGAPGYFTTAFFHHPDELLREAAEAGLAVAALLAIEGPAPVVPDVAAWWADPARRERLLGAIRAVEAEPSLLGLSPHLLVVGRKPDE